MVDHCWHDLGIVLTSYPEQYPEVCCNCDAKRTRSYKIITQEGHGPFAPPVETRETVYWREPDGPCVPTAPAAREGVE